MGMVLVSFLASNLWAVFWQQSEWLVATVLPAVVVDLTNEERESAAASSLTRNPVLDKAATLKAEHMAKESYFAHHSPSGVTPWHWFDVAGYEYAHAGENLAVHFTDSTSLVTAWMNSPTHRENIVNQRFTEIGVGTARGTFQGYPTVFVVQLFGTPAAIPKTVAVAPTEPTAPAVSPQPAPELAESEPTEPDVAPVPTEPTTPTQVAGEQQTKETEPVVTEPSQQQPESVTEAPVVPEDSPTPDVATQPSAPETEAPLAVETATPPEEEVSNVTPQAGGWQVTGVYSTSSGAPVATLGSSHNQAGTSVAALATQPHRLLQWVYSALSLLVLAMVIFALRLEFRQRQYLQVAYSLGLLLLMGGLWFLHSQLTAGAVVV